MLNLIHRTFSSAVSVFVKKKLYLTLVRSHLLYGSVVWRPYLRKDILHLERLQRRATKYILNNYTSDYKSRLIKLGLLPLSLVLENKWYSFFLKSLQSPSASFNIYDFVSFSNSSTHSSTMHKLEHFFSTSTSSCSFNCLPRLWNCLPSLEQHVSVSVVIGYIKFFWIHFTSNFNLSDPCSYHLICPCYNCLASSASPNFH